MSYLQDAAETSVHCAERQNKLHLGGALFALIHHSISASMMGYVPFVLVSSN